MIAQKKPKVVTKIADAFESLLPERSRRKCYVNKTYLRKRKLANDDNVHILPFQNADAKEMIIQWLSNTQNKFERTTQSQEIYDFCEDDNDSFTLPSVSQKNNTQPTKREFIHLRSRKIKRPHSLNLKHIKTTAKRACVSFNTCDYNIEEIETDMENNSVQKNIIQQLEDDFLDSIETEIDITKDNSRLNNGESDVAVSGWKRMKQMKKNDCKSDKKAKKLKTNATINTNNSVRVLRSRSKSKVECKNVNLCVDEGNIVEKSEKIKKSRVTNKTIAKLKHATVVSGQKIDFKQNSNSKNSKNALKPQNLAVEIIDLTLASPKLKNIDKITEKLDKNCEIIIKNIAKSSNVALNTTKNKLSLNLLVNSNDSENFEVIPSLNNDEISSQRNQDDIFAMVTQQINENNLIDIIAPSESLHEHIFGLETQKIIHNKIPLQLSKIQKLLQNNYTNIDFNLQNILTAKLNDILQLLDNYSADKSESVAIQLRVSNDTCAVQTDFTDCLAKSTQTSDVSRSDKCLQTSELGEVKNDVEVSMREKIINSIVDKFLASQDVVETRQCDLAAVRRTDNDVDDGYLENNRLIDKQIRFNDVELFGVSELDKNREDDLNLTDFDNANLAAKINRYSLFDITQTQPNKYLNKVESLKQIKSVEIVSETQPNVHLNKLAPLKQLKNIEIVSETQLNIHLNKLESLKQLKNIEIVSETQPNIHLNKLESLKQLKNIEIVSETQPNIHLNKLEPLKELKSVGIVSQMQPNIHLNKLAILKQLKNIEIVSETQPNIHLNKLESLKQLESIGIVSQTQPNIHLNKLESLKQLKNIEILSETQPNIHLNTLESLKQLESVGIVSQMQPNIHINKLAILKQLKNIEIVSETQPNIHVNNLESLNEIESVCIVSQTQPNIHLNKPEFLKRLESVGIVSETQPNIHLNKLESLKQLESVGIVSQTQPNIHLNKLAILKQVKNIEIVSETQPNIHLKQLESPKQLENIEIASDTQPNIHLNKLAPLKELKNTEIVSETQPNIHLNKPSSLKQLDSIGIVSQTQLNRSPMKLKLFRAKLSDNTVVFSANSEVGCEKLVKSPSNSEISIDKVHGQLDFTRKMKRIRFPDDTDSDEDQPTLKKRLKNKFVRDDLSIEFQTELNSDDNLLPDDLPSVINDSSLDFDLEDCLRNIENNFNSSEKLAINKNKRCIDNNVCRSKTNDTILIKSPESAEKKFISSDDTTSNDTEKCLVKLVVLDNILIQKPDKQNTKNIESEDEIIYSDDSFDNQTKSPYQKILTTPKKHHHPNMSKKTPDTLKSPSISDTIVLPPPPEFANATPQISQANTLNYHILNISPIKPLEDQTNFALSLKTVDKLRAKPLNMSRHSTPKIKQNTLHSYVKRAQLNRSFSQETEDLMKRNSQESLKADQPCIACSRLSKDDVIAVTALVRRKLGSFRNAFDGSVTHMIVSVNADNMVRDHTMKYILAVSAGIWVVNADWVRECVKNNSIVEERPFEVLDVFGSPGPKESRLYREINPLLSKFRIFTSGPFRTTEKNIIEDVIRNMGGTVIDDLNDFLHKNNSIDLVITEASSTQSFFVDDDWLNVYRIATVDIEWLSRSVGQYKILSFLPFLLCDADEIKDLNKYPQKYLDNIPGFTFSTQRE